MRSLRFEWNEVKDLSNRRKHDLSFAVGAQAFDDPLCLTYRDRVVDGEERLQTLGMVQGLLLVMVAHTLREETEDDLEIEIIRIISVRHPTRKERRFYEEENG